MLNYNVVLAHLYGCTGRAFALQLALVMMLALAVALGLATFMFKICTVKIIKFGTPQTIAIIVLKIEKFDVTLH